MGIKTARKTLYVLALLAASCVALLADTGKTLEDIYGTAGDYSVKKHINLASGYMERAMINNYINELGILAQIDPLNADSYNKLKQEAAGQIQAFASGQPGNTQMSQGQQLFSQAMSAYRESRLDNAMDILNRILLAEPDNVPAQNLKAQINSEVFTSSSVEMFTDAAQSSYNNGMNFYRKGLYQQAQTEFGKGLAVDPINAQLKRYMALASPDADRTKATESERYMMTGDAMYKDNDIQAARAEYDKAAKADPSNPKAAAALKLFDQNAVDLVAQSKNLLTQNKGSEAYIAVVKALEFSPANQAALAAEAQIKSAISGDKAADLLYNRGADAYAKGDYVSAVAAWQKVLAISPNDAQTKDAIQKANNKLADQQAANKAAVAASLKKATDYMNQGVLDMASGLFEYVLRLDPENKDASNGLKKISTMRGDAVYDNSSVGKK